MLGACGGPDSPTAGGAGSGSGSARTGIGVDAFARAASCAITPEQTLGPYYIDVDSIRGDIREDRDGTPLRLAVPVLEVDGCTPVKAAVFDVWHADAGGLYSGFESPSPSRWAPCPPTATMSSSRPSAN